MLYPLIVRDFLDRAEQVYPDRVAVVDEPDQPAPSLGELTYREMAALARAQAARLDQLGVPVGGRVAVVSQNSARLLTSFFGVSGWGRVLVPINFRLAEPEIHYIVEHCGAAAVFADPALRDVLPTASMSGTGSCWARTTRCTRAAAEPRPWAGRRERHRDDQLHLGYDRPPQGRAADPPQPVAQRHGVRPARHDQRPRRATCTRCRCSTPTAGACRSRSPAWAAGTSCCARWTGRRSCAGSTRTASP